MPHLGCVVLLAAGLCATVTSVSATLSCELTQMKDQSEFEWRCTCDPNKPHIKTIIPHKNDVEFFRLSDCHSFHMIPEAFSHFNELTEIVIERVADLTFDAVLPSTLRSLEFRDIQLLHGLHKSSFSAVATLRYLTVQNVTLGRVEPGTFERVAISEANFADVTFSNLPGGALAMRFDETSDEYPQLVFESSTFAELAFEPMSISTSHPVNVRFRDNVLDCEDVQSSYYLIWQLMRKHVEASNSTHCDFLAKNFCSGRRAEEDRLSYRIFRELKSSTGIGLQLDKVCPDLYEQYRKNGEGKTPSIVSTGTQSGAERSSASYLLLAMSWIFFATSVVYVA